MSDELTMSVRKLSESVDALGATIKKTSEQRDLYRKALEEMVVTYAWAKPADHYRLALEALKEGNKIRDESAS